MRPMALRGLACFRESHMGIRGSGPRHCEALVPGRAGACGATTREGKPFCSDHVENNPYVQSLQGLLSYREDRDRVVGTRGASSEDVESGISVQEILQHLVLHGARTEERLCRELNHEPKVIARYLSALARRRLVATGHTARGSKVAKVTKAGEEHLANMKVPRPRAPEPPEPPKPEVEEPAPMLVPANEAFSDPEPLDPLRSAPEPELEPEPEPEPEPEIQVTEKVSDDVDRLSEVADAKSAAGPDRGTFMKVSKKPPFGDLARSRAELDGALAELEQACEKVGDASYLSHAITAQAEAAMVAAATIRLLVRALGGAEAKPAATKQPKAKATKKAQKAHPAKPAKKAASKRSGGRVVGAEGLARWILLARQKSGLSQQAFGAKIGASYTQVWHWEKGNRAPGATFLSKIEKIAGEAAPVAAGA